MSLACCLYSGNFASFCGWKERRQVSAISRPRCLVSCPPSGVREPSLSCPGAVTPGEEARVAMEYRRLALIRQQALPPPVSPPSALRKLAVPSAPIHSPSSPAAPPTSSTFQLSARPARPTSARRASPARHRRLKQPAASLSVQAGRESSGSRVRECRVGRSDEVGVSSIRRL